MCGIAGIVSLNNQPIKNIKIRTEKMLSSLNARGPDDSGYWLNEKNTLSIINTRLSIVDVNSKFSVPFISNSKKSILSFNGEVYNYLDIAKKIRSAGKVLQYNSDTEVLAEALELNGLSILDQLDGFWSFAFFNKTENNLILSRDLMGEKGLYYLKTKDELIFCSEIKPILLASKNLSEIDYLSLVSSFSLRASPPGKSLIKGISKLSPGTSLSCNLYNGEIKTIVSQNFKLEPWLDFFNSSPSEKKILDIYDEQLYEAIKIRVPNEVNFYNTLSGGIDSALINIYSQGTVKSINTIYMHSSEKPPIKGDDFLNEYEASLLTSKILGTSHDSFSLFSEMGVNNYINSASNCFDGLFCEGLPSFATIAEYIKNKNSKVLLLSDGPDEFLGGYEHDIYLYQDVNNRDYITNNKNIQTSRKENLNLYNNKPFKFRTIHGGTSLVLLNNIFSREILKLFEPVYGSIGKNYSYLENELDIAQKMALSYALYSLPDYFNTRIDRSTMMHSIESRVPLQSVSLANLMIATPGKWKYKNNYTKYLLRKIVERYLGKDIAFRKKYGFAFPIWKNEVFKKKLYLDESILDSNLFSSQYMKNNFSKIDDRIKYMFFCATKTYNHLQEINQNNKL